MRLRHYVPAAGFVALWAVSAAASDVGTENATRVRNGLLALYDFQSVEGDIVKDLSGLGEPADLKIRALEAVRLSEGSVELLRPTTIRSLDRVEKISDMVRRSGELSVEVWIKPAAMAQTSTAQTSPARILSMSNGKDQRNFSLTQAGDRFGTQFRITEAGVDVWPPVPAAAGASQPELTHVVYTRDRTGRARLFLNGDQAVERMVPGDTSDWEKTSFFLGNEPKINQPWLGAYYLVAVYGRDLMPGEVARNFRAGPAPVPADLSAVDEKTRHFETKIAPLLATRCLECHDSVSKQGGLDLSKKAAAFAGGANGKAIKPGSATESLLWLMAEAESMPKGRPPLSPEEKRLLGDWIDAGAVWSYETIDRAVYGHGDRAMGNWVQRLTVSEYIETVRGTLGVDISKQAREILPRDLRADGFKNTAYNLNVDLGHVQAYARLAEAVVARIDVAAFAGAGPELTDSHIATMVKRILRGPISEHELALYRRLAGTVTEAGGSFEDAAGYVIEAMLQSPHFLYRIEQQRGDGTAWPADAHELASRLSYILWGSPPDAELMAAADSGALYHRAEVERHVRRMLADPRAVARSAEFIDQWLDLDRLSTLQPNPAKFPDWDPTLAADMRRETLAFFEDVVWKQKGPLSNLLNARFSYLTPRLAEHYGLEPKGPGLERYDFSSPAVSSNPLSSTPGRGGLLTQGSVLTVGGDEASMVTRGLFILQDLLFGEVGDPPPGLDTSPVPTGPGQSHRTIAMGRVESPACGGCHARFEPLAFGLEKFDGLGSYHEVDEHGNTLRQDGEILFPGEAASVSYRTSAEMMDLLAGSDRVRRNIARKLTQFAIGRPLVAADEPTIERIHQSSREGGGTYETLITAIVMSDLVQTTRTEF